MMIDDDSSSKASKQGEEVEQLAAADTFEGEKIKTAGENCTPVGRWRRRPEFALRLVTKNYNCDVFCQLHYLWVVS